MVILLEVDLEGTALDRRGALALGAADDAAAIQRFLWLLDALQAQAFQSRAMSHELLATRETTAQRGRNCYEEFTTCLNVC